MAIKIGGTVVINDSQEFTNINSIVFPGGTQTSAGGGSNPLSLSLDRGAPYQFLSNPNIFSTGVSDNFGISVAISKKYVAIGANGEDSVSWDGPGVVYVFDIETGSIVHILRNPNAYSTPQFDAFGQTIAMSDSHIIVGVLNEDDAGGMGGKAYIFDIETGSLLHSLNNPNAFSTSDFDFFGLSVAISGNYAVVGAPYEENAQGTNSSGKVYVFDVSSGILRYTLDNPRTGTNDGEFGHAIAADGDRLIVGAPLSSVNDLWDGRSYIYKLSNGQLLHTLINPEQTGGIENDQFGYSVDISGNFCIVSAGQNGFSDGKAYIYNVTTGALVHTLSNPNYFSTAGDDYFGFKVSISNNLALVGAPYEDDDSGGTNSGIVYVFDVSTGTFLFAINNPFFGLSGNNDVFGRVMDISGEYCVVGVRNQSDGSGSGSGRAYVFTINDFYKLNNVESLTFSNGLKFSEFEKLLEPAHGQGELLHVLNNPNVFSTSASDSFGQALAVYGNICVIGVPDEDGIYGGSPVTSSGNVYVFDITNGRLLYTLNNPNAYSTSANDKFGTSVAVFKQRIIVSAPGDQYFFSSSRNNVGKVYIFDSLGGRLLRIIPYPPGGGGGELFGYRVAISQNYCAVSTINVGDAGGANSGKVYIFNVNSGALIHTLNNPNAYSTSANDFFGYRVAINDDYCLVVASGEDDSAVGGTNSGKAYLFDIKSGTLVRTLNNPLPEVNTFEFFGDGCALSDRYAVIGVRGESFDGLLAGQVYVYDLENGTLSYTIANPNVYGSRDSDSFGADISINEDYCVISSVETDQDALANNGSGKVFIYDVKDNFALKCVISNPNAYSTSTNDAFTNVAITDNYLVVAAPSEDDPGGSSSGKAYIFALRDLTKLDKLITLVE